MNLILADSNDLIRIGLRTILSAERDLVIVGEAQNSTELTSWQKNVIDERLNEYYKNPLDVSDFDKMMDDIENTL
jgi:hypothetical protein